VVRYRTNWYCFTRGRYGRKRLSLKDTIINIRELSGQPVAAALPDGGAVVVYQSVRKHETNSWGLTRSAAWNGRRTITNDVVTPTRIFIDWMQDVYLQRLSAEGQKAGPELRVNQNADYNQRSPAVAVLPNGNFVVAWVSEQQWSFDYNANFRIDIYARLFNSQSEPLGDEFRVNGSEALMNANPAVVALSGNSFAIAWSQQETARSRRWDVVSQACNADGTPAGSPQLVNVHTAGDQFGPKIAGVGDNQMVVWTSVGQDGSREGVYGRLLVRGRPTGEEIRVNTTTISRQLQPAVGADAQGRVLAVWASFTGPSGFDLFGQAYSLPMAVTPPPGNALLVHNASFGKMMVFANNYKEVVLPAPTASGPFSLGLAGSLQALQLHWSTQAGIRYQVEKSSDLKNWTAVGEPRMATGASDATSVGVDVAEPAAFYRVIQLR
jgi:hypothetical protein